MFSRIQEILQTETATKNSFIYSWYCTPDLQLNILSSIYREKNTKYAIVMFIFTFFLFSQITDPCFIYKQPNLTLN